MRLGRREARYIPPAGNQSSGTLGDLLPLLRCPRTRAELRPGLDGSLVSENGRSSYPVVAGVPILIDDARSLVDALWTVDGRARSLDDASRGPAAVRRAAPPPPPWPPPPPPHDRARRPLARRAPPPRLRGPPRRP